ncbi:MAG: hypothetical protein K1Y36_26710 [Blastocatellia bacterium]|nr:hypothetical protein [Blastocatellia bacterium]
MVKKGSSKRFFRLHSGLEVNSGIIFFILLSLTGGFPGWAQSTQTFLVQAKPQPNSTALVVGESFRLKSSLLNEEREISVYLPSGYATSKQRYPVIVALDGEGTAPVAANAVAFLTRNLAISQMPEALVIGVKNTNRNRDMPVPREYGNGGEAKFLAFLADELLPLVEQRYRTLPLRILLGHSQGGLFAHYALTARPTVFQWYLALDAPLAGFPESKSILEKVRQLTRKPDFQGRLISLETLYGWKKEWPSLLEKASRGLYAEQVEIKDETHETMVYKGIYEGLKRLFHDYAPNLLRDNQGLYPLARLEERYRELSKAYGYEVRIPQSLLVESANRFLARQDGAQAEELLKRVVLLYGASPGTRQLLAQAEAVRKKGTDPRLAEWSQIPPPEPEHMKPFLGTWESRRKDGAVWLMTFEMRNGVVLARSQVTPPNGEAVQLEVQFVRVREGGTIEWGLVNGMGGGIIFHSGKLTNANTLEGTIEPVGIQHAPPPRPFVYLRSQAAT